jgi:hypothetical protein
MDRHRLGPKYGIPVESMCFTEVQLYGDPNPEYTIKNLLSLDPRIISGQLCLRVQQWALFCAIIPLDSAIVEFPKVSTHEYMVRSDSLSFVKCKLEHSSGSNPYCLTCGEVLRWQWRCTDYKAEIMDLNEHGKFSLSPNGWN